MNKTEARYGAMKQFTVFYPRFRQFDELGSAIEMTAADPENLLRLYGTYRSYVKRMAHLTPTDLAILSDIREQYPLHRGALHFIEKFGPSRMGELKSSLDRAVSPDSPTYQDAVDDLFTMMNRAQSITADPHDAAGTEQMIYGYRVIRDDPGVKYRHRHFTEAELHFVFCHFLERALFKSVSPADPSVSWQKDDFLGALGDVMMLVDEQSRKLGEWHRSKPEYEIWGRAKTDGGLGWIKSDYVHIAFNHVHELLNRQFREERPWLD